MPILRKSFLVNPRLQFKYLMMSLILTLITAAIVYLTLSHILFTSDRLMELSTFEIEALQKSLRIALLWITLILLIVFGLENFLRFHRFVGPLFVIEKMVHTFSMGDLSQDFRLRKGDELQALVDELIEMRNHIKLFVEDDRKICRSIDDRLAQLSKSVSQGMNQEKMVKEIDEIQKELRTISCHYKI